MSVRLLSDCQDRFKEMDSPLDNFSPEKRAAYNRLKKDFAIIARNAKRTSKSVENYLLDLGIDKEVIQFLARDVQAANEAGQRQIIEKPISATPEPQQIAESSLQSIERRKSMAKMVLNFFWSWSFLRAFAVLFFMALAAYFVFTYREDNRYSISSNSSGTFVMDKRTGEIEFLIVQPNGGIISLKEYRNSKR
jgi:hypothetical protein